MRNPAIIFIAALLTGFVFITCSKINSETQNPRLYITLKDTSGKAVVGATVRLYKNPADPGITKISDSSGIVIFSDLDVAIYYWLAEKGCKTNRNSQVTLNRALITGATLYGYSVLSETGTLKIINTSPEAYNITDSAYNTVDSVFHVRINKDSIYTTYQKAGSYLIHSEKLSTPGIGKDTLIKITCGNTFSLNLPY